MHYLVIDTRFKAPVHVFLEQDPGVDKAFPGLTVRRVDLDTALTEPARGAYGTGVAVGQNPYATSFRLFQTDRTAVAAGYAVVEPRYIGVSWAAYSRVFRYGGKTVGRE